MVRRIQIQERDHSILEHIERYRMSTPGVLKAKVFKDLKPEAMKSCMRRLREAGYVATAPLSPPRHLYYHLANRGAHLLGVSTKHAKPLGEQALPTRLAVLSFCCGPNGSEVLTASEFKEEFSDCLSKGVPVEPYYYDAQSGAPRLSFIMVDMGADAGRIIRKCRKAFGERMKVAGFRSLIEEDAFSVTVLTPRESKKAATIAALKRAKDFHHPIRIEVVPELTGVL